MEQRKHYLRPRDVARLFSVSLPTVRRWVQQGKLTAVVTPGGHNRIDATSTYRVYESCVVHPDHPQQ